MTVREFIQDELEKQRKKAAGLSEILYNLPPQLDGSGLGELESDSISIYHIDSCGIWLTLSDETHKDLGARLATLADQSGHFRVYGTTRHAHFKDVGPFYRIDLYRPNPKCRKVRVLRPAKEIEMEICGDIPEGYTLLGDFSEYDRQQKEN